jgi:3-deoxy-D-manno-octulosonic-acid transferase
MYFLYNLAIELVAIFLPVTTLFSEKMYLFVKGRKKTFELLENKLQQNDRSIWFHCASLGEFEQGRPIIEQCRQLFPEHKIILSFYSPSGYEAQKDYQEADLVLYLPVDTRRRAKKFVRLLRADMAVFVKYEFWPNLLR